jgi:hypothetical protein
VNWNIALEFKYSVIAKKGTTTLSQSKYLSEILNKFRMSDCKPVSTPMEPFNSKKKQNSMSNREKIDFPYRSCVGKLSYAALITRPDIAVAVSYCSRYQQNPIHEHFVAIKRILRNIKGTQNLGIVFKASGKNEFKLVGYSDADYGGCTETRKSTSGYCFLLCNGVISWRTCKQQCISTSTVESEYVALKYAVQEAVWLRRLLVELGFPQSEPTTIHEDNQGCISLAKNPHDHSRTKHIDICYHYSRSKVKDGTIKLVFCRTNIMIADIFTKPLPLRRFQELTELLGMHHLSGSVGNDGSSDGKSPRFYS